jgi:hypothetical protein
LIEIYIDIEKKLSSRDDLNEMKLVDGDHSEAKCESEWSEE